jgi:hypothetical protein
MDRICATTDSSITSLLHAILVASTTYRPRRRRRIRGLQEYLARASCPHKEQERPDRKISSQRWSLASESHRIVRGCDGGAAQAPLAIADSSYSAGTSRRSSQLCCTAGSARRSLVASRGEKREDDIARSTARCRARCRRKQYARGSQNSPPAKSASGCYNFCSSYQPNSPPWARSSIGRATDS